MSKFPPIRFTDGMNRLKDQCLHVVGVMYNPSAKWLDAVYRYSLSVKKAAGLEPVPVYGGCPIEAVLMVGDDAEIASPDVRVANWYGMIPFKSAKLAVIEFDDGSLWESMTDDVPTSVYPGQSPIVGETWEENFSLWCDAERCRKLIGDRVLRLFMLRRLGGDELVAHLGRFKK